jgi:hypothetical protein
MMTLMMQQRQHVPPPPLLSPPVADCVARLSAGRQTERYLPPDWHAFFAERWSPADRQTLDMDLDETQELLATLQLSFPVTILYAWEQVQVSVPPSVCPPVCWSVCPLIQAPTCAFAVVRMTCGWLRASDVDGPRRWGWRQEHHAAGALGGSGRPGAASARNVSLGFRVNTKP